MLVLLESPELVITQNIPILVANDGQRFKEFIQSYLVLGDGEGEVAGKVSKYGNIHEDSEILFFVEFSDNPVGMECI